MSGSRLEGNWFREEDASWSGYSISLQVENVLFKGSSPFQDILVFKSSTFGVVLVLDGVIQCTERDEFTYQEMISHLSLNTHPNPQKVLVIGGGDGGVVREVLKYQSVSSIVLCEIDEAVIEVCQKFLPSMASCLDDDRVSIHVGDGTSYVKQHSGEFDVIITDAPDAMGMAECLYQKSFYQDLQNALKSDGIVCLQGETSWFDLELIKGMVNDCRSIFPQVAYAVGNTPTYVGGQMGYLICSNNPKAKLKQPIRRYSDEELEKMSVRYYSPDVHVASFVLPFHIKKALDL